MGRSTRVAAPAPEFSPYMSPNGDLRGDDMDRKRQLDIKKKWQYGAKLEVDGVTCHPPVFNLMITPHRRSLNKKLNSQAHHENEREIERTISQCLDEFRDMSEVSSDVYSEKLAQYQQSSTAPDIELLTTETCVANFLDKYEEDQRQQEFERLLDEYVMVNSSDFEF